MYDKWAMSSMNITLWSVLRESDDGMIHHFSVHIHILSSPKVFVTTNILSLKCTENQRELITRFVLNAVDHGMLWNGESTNSPKEHSFQSETEDDGTSFIGKTTTQRVNKRHTKRHGNTLRAQWVIQNTLSLKDMESTNGIDHSLSLSANNKIKSTTSRRLAVCIHPKRHLLWVYANDHGYISHSLWARDIPPHSLASSHREYIGPKPPCSLSPPWRSESVRRRLFVPFPLQKGHEVLILVHLQHLKWMDIHWSPSTSSISEIQTVDSRTAGIFANASTRSVPSILFQTASINERYRHFLKAPLCCGAPRRLHRHNSSWMSLELMDWVSFSDRLLLIIARGAWR